MGRALGSGQHEMMRARALMALAAMLLCLAAPAGATDLVIYSFEGSVEGWTIPDWAKTSDDYAGRALSASEEQAQDGSHALVLQAAFPGGRWTGAYVERELDVVDWSPFSQIQAGICLPAFAPEGLQGKIILTVGDQWTWTEMNRTIPLTPGAWTTITVNLKPGSMDWKFFPDEQFRKSIRKLGVRVESNKQPPYSGPVWIDAIRLVE